MASGSRSITGGSEEAFLYECDPCKNQKITSEAKAYCTVCTEYLCQKCEVSHKGSKASCDHKILTGNRFHSHSMTTKPKTPVMYCEVHKTMALNLFCKSHDDVICDTCKITDHRKCVITDVSNQTKHAKVINTLDRAVNSLTDLKTKFEKLKDSRKADKGEVKSQVGKCLEDMRKIREEINESFDKLERKFEKNMRETEEKMTKEIEGHVTIVEDALVQISDQIKSLNVCRKTKDENVMFIGMKKANKLKNKYDQTMSTVQEAVCPVDLRFRPNDVIIDVVQQLDNIGTLEIKGQPSLSRQRAASLLHMTAVDKKAIDVGARNVYDCTFMESGHVALACYDRFLLLDETFNVQSQLSIKARRVAAIDEDEVMVIVGVHHELLRVRLFPQMVVMATVKMDTFCWGVDVLNDEIYVACHDGKGHGEVRVLNIDGTLKKMIGAQKYGHMFKMTSGIKVSRDGRKIFVSDVGTNMVTCLSQQGHVIYEYSDQDLKDACGLYVDEEDNLLVCGCDSNNIHMVDRDGRRVKVWLTQKDGVVKPGCLSYRAADGVLGVGLVNSSKPLIVFTTNLS